MLCFLFQFKFKILSQWIWQRRMRFDRLLFMQVLLDGAGLWALQQVVWHHFATNETFEMDALHVTWMQKLGCTHWFWFFEYKPMSTLSGKVENISKGSLDLIPSPSPLVKIQIMSGKVCLSCKGETMLGIVNKLLKTISLLTSSSNVLPYYLN